MRLIQLDVPTGSERVSIIAALIATMESDRIVHVTRSQEGFGQLLNSSDLATCYKDRLIHQQPFCPYEMREHDLVILDQLLPSEVSSFITKMLGTDTLLLVV